MHILIQTYLLTVIFLLLPLCLFTYDLGGALFSLLYLLLFYMIIFYT